MNITSSGSRVLAGLALGAVALTGCGASGSTASGDSADATSSPTGQPSSAASSEPGGSSPTMSASPSARGSGDSSSDSNDDSSDDSNPDGMGGSRCRTADLRVSVSAGEGAAGSTYYEVRLRNVSTHACRTGGFGGVSLVRTPSGAPVGAPADRVRKGAARPLTLAPGKHAEATLQVTNAANYPAHRCRPTPVKGLRVYPPNETRSAYVPLATTACRSPRVHLLSLQPYHLAG